MLFSGRMYVRGAFPQVSYRVVLHNTPSDFEQGFIFGSEPPFRSRHRRSVVSATFIPGGTRRTLLYERGSCWGI